MTLPICQLIPETLLGYIDWLAQWTLDPDPWTTALKVQLAWNYMQVRHTLWPTAKLSLPPLR
jgi:hypothetical protein